MLDRDQGIGVVLEFAAAVLTAEELALVRLEFLDGDGQAVRVVGPEELVNRLEEELVNRLEGGAGDGPAGRAGPVVGRPGRRGPSAGVGGGRGDRVRSVTPAGTLARTGRPGRGQQDQGVGRVAGPPAPAPGLGADREQPAGLALVGLVDRERRAARGARRRVRAVPVRGILPDPDDRGACPVSAE